MEFPYLKSINNSFRKIQFHIAVRNIEIFQWWSFFEETAEGINRFFINEIVTDVQGMELWFSG